MKITKQQLKQIIKEELEDIKKDPAYKRGRKDGKAKKDKQAGMEAEKARPNGSVKKYEQGWLSGHEIAETGGD